MIMIMLLMMMMMMMMTMIGTFWKSILTLGTNCGVTHRQPPIIGLQILSIQYFSYKRWDKTLLCFASFYRLTPKTVTAWNILTKIQDTQTSHKGTK